MALQINFIFQRNNYYIITGIESQDFTNAKYRKDGMVFDFIHDSSTHILALPGASNSRCFYKYTCTCTPTVQILYKLYLVYSSASSVVFS